MARIVLLANSWRPDGRCLAGIDLENKQWVRPVPKNGDAIPEFRCYVKNRLLALRDILEVDLIRPRETPKYQMENQTILDWNWQANRRLKLECVADYVDNDTPILHNAGDRVAPYELDELPADSWKSLQLVRPGTLSFEKDAWNRHRWRALFTDIKRNAYALPITDPLLTQKLEKQEPIGKKCLLTVSLTKPWAPKDASKLPMCYKLVAAAVELE